MKIKGGGRQGSRVCFKWGGKQRHEFEDPEDLQPGWCMKYSQFLEFFIRVLNFCISTREEFKQKQEQYLLREVELHP